MKQRKSATKKTSKEDKSSGKETKKITTTETKTKTTTTATAPATTTDAKKASLSNLKTRTWTSIVMIALFAAVVYLGHWACFAVVVFCQVAMFKELENVRTRGAQTQVQLISKISNWSFFVAFAWGVTGRVLVITFGEQWLRFGVLGVLLVRYHTMITYTLYCVAFVAFVLSLRSGHLKEQFKSFAWTHMILLVVMLQVNLWEHTLFKGLFWFVLPASLVIVNDVFAFVFGKLFGRHPLISLSPHKTWEGFVGGMLSTFVWGFFLSRLLSRWSWLTCPKTDLFTWGVVCAPDPLFQKQLYTAPAWLLGGFSFHARPVQFHTLVFVLFASLVAPFGGFFASGLKRAFGVKDFDHVIPGHGGVTDRMDCQFLMGSFVNLYYNTFLVHAAAVPAVMDTIIALDNESQLEIFTRLASILNKTILP